MKTVKGAQCAGVEWIYIYSVFVEIPYGKPCIIVVWWGRREVSVGG